MTIVVNPTPGEAPATPLEQPASTAVGRVRKGLSNPMASAVRLARSMASPSSVYTNGALVSVINAVCHTLIASVSRPRAASVAPR